jgi:hypothetical protein
MGRYVIVEQAGMVDEHTTGGSFESAQEARDYIRRHYDADELDTFSTNCLHVEVAFEENGELSFEIY